jgi:TM2 domain-containing membrane protein YozV
MIGLCSFLKGKAGSVPCEPVFLSEDSVVMVAKMEVQHDKRPREWWVQLRKRIHAKNRKITAAILAFPFPFGIVGLHRVYLGTSAFVPVVYVATIGGCVGIIPLVDFIVILLSDDLTPYENNDKIFIWK